MSRLSAQYWAQAWDIQHPLVDLWELVQIHRETTGRKLPLWWITFYRCVRAILRRGARG